MKGVLHDSPLARAWVVVVGYLLVTAAVIGVPSGSAPAPDSVQPLADGAAVWRREGCATCHAIFGLGGHVGPDLTDVVERRGAGYVTAMLRMGRPGMPVYTALEEGEVAGLLAYLGFVAGTGEYPQRGSPLAPFGRRP